MEKNEDRQKAIRDLLGMKEFVSVDSLAETLGVRAARLAAQTGKGWTDVKYIDICFN